MGHSLTGASVRDIDHLLVRVCAAARSFSPMKDDTNQLITDVFKAYGGEAGPPWTTRSCDQADNEKPA